MSAPSLQMEDRRELGKKYALRQINEALNGPNLRINNNKSTVMFDQKPINVFSEEIEELHTVDNLRFIIPLVKPTSQKHTCNHKHGQNLVNIAPKSITNKSIIAEKPAAIQKMRTLRRNARSVKSNLRKSMKEFVNQLVPMNNHSFTMDMN